MRFINNLFLELVCGGTSYYSLLAESAEGLPADGECGFIKLTQPFNLSCAAGKIWWIFIIFAIGRGGKLFTFGFQ